MLIRLSDNSVLPNRFRGEYRDCFVIAPATATSAPSAPTCAPRTCRCVRADGMALEVKIQGSVYGEDGKVGMRGRLVTKQGQMLANALLAGVVSGIGQGLAISSTTYSTSAPALSPRLPAPMPSSPGWAPASARRWTGWRQYYIKLAENTFPVIEVDAGREIDVVITKGVRIDVPMASQAGSSDRSDTAAAHRYPEASDDDTY